MLNKDTAVAAQNEESLFQETKNPNYKIVEELFSSSFDDDQDLISGAENDEFTKNDVDSWILQSIADAAQIDKNQH